MAEQTRGDRPDNRMVKGSLEFMGLGQQTAPEVRMETISPEGQRTEIPISPTGEFQLGRELGGKGYRLEVRGISGGTPRRFNYDRFVEQIQKDAVFRIPQPLWEKWLFFMTCVTGRVVRCRPIFLPPLPFIDLLQRASIKNIDLSPIDLPVDLGFQLPPFPRICEPVCEGKIEVFIRTCCCPPIGPLDPPVIIKDICEIIDCDPIPWPPEPFPPRPWPPFREEPHLVRPPQPGPDPELERATLRALKRSSSVEGAISPSQVLRLTQHLTALRRLPLQEQIRYIEVHPDLLFWHCKCSTVKVAEVPLQEGGYFDACFYLSPFLPANCTRRVQYKVSQFQGDSWVMIYDGPARGETFALDEDADIEASYSAQTCDDREFPDGTPFVILEQIGNTWADTLIHSTQQNAESSFAGPLSGTDGLANESPAGPVAVTSGPYNQPWGTTLNLRYQFHPGLQALGATYYRTRVIRINNSGQPMAGGPNFVLTGDVSWRKYYPQPGGGVGVQWAPLNNPVINGFDGLYTIPFPDPVWPWLGGQWHSFVVTDELVASVPRMPNGRYLFVVDIFNAAGQRLVPSGSLEPAAGGEVSAAFEYRRLDGPIDDAFSNTSVVPYNALANLFWVDNLSCYGDIEQITHNGIPSATNCQFIEGPGTDTLQLRYSAYQNNGFQWYHRIRYKQGLTGPTTWLPASNSNVFSGDSPALTLSALLGSEVKCAFAANLYVYARHTNGIGRIEAYDREDVAAFALEIT